MRALVCVPFASVILCATRTLAPGGSSPARLFTRGSVLRILPFLLILPGTAFGFCGTYVGPAGSTLSNEASQIVVVRQGQQTTLTMANDYSGDADQFAVVIPVPEILEAKDVRLASADLLTRLDEYSTPRLVRYSCDNLYSFKGGKSQEGSTQQDQGALPFSCGSESEFAPGEVGSNSPPAETAVQVESSFAVGAYEFVVLSAEDSSDLLTWLSGSGFGVPADAADLLGEYIDAGSYFLAARVNLGALPIRPSFLSPIQISYTADLVSLPIRLGTLNSTGEQELLLYTIGDEGAAGISNYPEVEPTNECMYDSASMGTLEEFYGDVLDEAFANSEAAWMLEYAWGNGKCDPCSGPPIADEDLSALGFDIDAGPAYLSRIRARYAASADQDLVVYFGGDESKQFQMRYIMYDESMEEQFPVCFSGWIEDGGHCEAEVPSEGAACSSGGLPHRFPALLLLAVAGLLFRRRGIDAVVGR